MKDISPMLKGKSTRFARESLREKQFGIKEGITMKDTIFHKMALSKVIFFVLMSFLALMLSNPVFGHGGKTHADNITHLKALQKATALLDRLIGKGNLGAGWETDLKTVKIDSRQKKGKREIVVIFHRAKGEKRTVYFFFTAEGKYAGSNFTGK